ncbi:dTDP-4-amino-4,6-dideoxy-D-glucose transaminase [Cyanobium usitatum str. Tous]|jgi:dTDP-4-amino-4,6-dideoxygalactose transaminase|uniref:DegT/DnrJ/EryC1/StrS family aminotransferase n=1 Tax=Cyanobium usitatum TaxID=2304190 RepID=UPI002AD29507|nr:aminotransferase class I/II-fold pyridoxal phosphate-dependent enzyme [Cyanobium usitatum]CAK6698206.1 dTDP-4-amino-4,6-dideoxy-D-glucose transaminase [Cyanobium usitatum str. Tous]
MKFPIIRPNIPPVKAWAGYLEEAYDSRRFSNYGPLSRRLESWLAMEWGQDCTTCVLTSSGTAAVAAPLIASGISGRVLLPAFTFPATYSAIKMAGAKPVLIDVCPADWRVSADALDDAFAATGAQAAIVVSPFGLRSDFSTHARIASRHGAILIIDNAAGLGVTRVPLESSDNVFEAYSLHATKPFGIGEGGAIFANHSSETALRRALNFGLPASVAEESPAWGINGKISEFHAAVGLAVASVFIDHLRARRAMAALYAVALADFPEVRCCIELDDSAWQVFPLLLPTREAADSFEEHTRHHGVEIRRYYSPSLSSYASIERMAKCHVSEDLSQRMCCLPVYSNASKAEVAEIVAHIASSLRRALRRI